MAKHKGRCSDPGSDVELRIVPLTRHNIAGIFLGHLFNNQYLDGVVSIAIGYC